MFVWQWEHPVGALPPQEKEQSGLSGLPLSLILRLLRKLLKTQPLECGWGVGKCRAIWVDVCVWPCLFSCVGQDYRDSLYTKITATVSASWDYIWGLNEQPCLHIVVAQLVPFPFPPNSLSFYLYYSIHICSDLMVIYTCPILSFSLFFIEV